MEHFAPRNIQNDTDLADVVGTITKLTKGLDVKALRDDVNLRAHTMKKFAEVKKVVDKLVEDRPRRSFSF